MRFPPLTPTVRALLVVFLVAFVAQLVSDVWLEGRLYELLSLSIYPGELRLANLWQLVTFPLAQIPGPQGISNLLFTGFLFYWIVAGLEQQYGSRWTRRVLAASLVGAALPSLAAGLLLGGRLDGFSVLTFGVLATGIWTMRTLRQRMSLFGQWEMTPNQALLFLLAFPAIGFLASKNALHLVADLGAMGAGILFVEVLARRPPGGRPSEKRSRTASGPRKNPHGLRAIRGGKDDDPHTLN